MSYILDALKKAERERGLRPPPVLSTVHESASQRWNYKVAIVCGLIVCAAAAFWFWLPERMGLHPPSGAASTDAEPHRPEAMRVAESRQPAAVPSSVTHSEPVTPRKAGDSQGRAPAGSSEKIVPIQGAPQIPINDGRTAIQPDKNTIAPPQGAFAPSNASSFTKEPPPALPAGAAVPEKAPPPVELAQSAPMSLKEAVSKMALNILVYYDEESARKVYISGKKYLKGDLVDGLYLVESITPEGVILSYKGERVLLR